MSQHVQGQSGLPSESSIRGLPEAIEAAAPAVRPDFSALANPGLVSKASVDSEVAAGEKGAASVTSKAPKRMTGKLEYKDPIPFHLLMDAETPVIEHLVLKGVLKFERIDFPNSEVNRFKAYVNKNTAAFLGPNHPEFMVDWMDDKLVATRVSPYMAHWADAGFVNQSRPSRLYWRMNGLIANSGGDKAVDFSIQHALKGHGVLLHPEGTVHWTADSVHRILPGIARMPILTAQAIANDPAHAGKEVYIVPFVTRMNFTTDVTAGLNKEMARLEKKFGLVPGHTGAPVEERFADFQVNLLRNRELRYDFKPAQSTTWRNFFENQQALFDHLIGQLNSVNGVQEGDLMRQVYLHERFAKAKRESDPKAAKAELRITGELQHLLGFSAEVYGGPTLSQEQMAESLKRVQCEIVDHGIAKAGFMDGMRKFLPIPVGPRELHIRMADPIEVTALVKPGVDLKALENELLVRTKDAMQSAVDKLKAETAMTSKLYERKNPFSRNENAA